MIEHVMSEALDWVLATPERSSSKRANIELPRFVLDNTDHKKGRAITPSETGHVIAQSVGQACESVMRPGLRGLS